MKAGIKGFYQSRFNIAPLVTLTYEDASGGSLLEGDENIYQYVYTIEVPTAITEASVGQIMTVPLSTTSRIDFVFPKDL